MANALDGTSTVCIVWKVPTQEGVQALRDFFEFHYTYMKEKSYQQGPLELVQYTISESPEYANDASWHDGAFPPTTGRTIFTLFEIYRTPDGLHHHMIDGKVFASELYEIATTYNIEFHLMNQMKVIQSLWD